MKANAERQDDLWKVIYEERDGDCVVKNIVIRPDLIFGYVSDEKPVAEAAEEAMEIILTYNAPTGMKWSALAIWKPGTRPNDIEISVFYETERVQASMSSIVFEEGFHDLLTNDDVWVVACPNYEAKEAA